MKEFLLKVSRELSRSTLGEVTSPTRELDTWGVNPLADRESGRLYFAHKSEQKCDAFGITFLT